MFGTLHAGDRVWLKRSDPNTGLHTLRGPFILNRIQTTEFVEGGECQTVVQYRLAGDTDFVLAAKDELVEDGYTALRNAGADLYSAAKPEAADAEAVA